MFIIEMLGTSIARVVIVYRCKPNVGLANLGAKGNNQMHGENSRGW